MGPIRPPTDRCDRYGSNLRDAERHKAYLVLMRELMTNAMLCTGFYTAVKAT